MLLLQRLLLHGVVAEGFYGSLTVHAGRTIKAKERLP